MADMNYNLATNTNYKVEIAGAPEFNYFIQSVSLPGMTMSGVDTPYQGYQAVMPSDRIDYDPLTFTFILSEDLSNYFFLYKWMKDIQSADYPREFFRDITLHILNNNKLESLKIVFYSCFPTSLAEVTLESAVTDTNPLTTTAMFRYQYFTLMHKDEN